MSSQSGGHEENRPEIRDDSEEMLPQDETPSPANTHDEDDGPELSSRDSSYSDSNSARRNGTAIACVGCLSAIVLGMLASILLFAVTSKSGKLPTPLRQADIAQCSLQLKELTEAMDRYKVSKGEYPKDISELYPDFLNSKSTLYCPSDLARKGKTSYVYIQPKPDAKSSTKVLFCKWHNTQKIKMDLEAALNGDVISNYKDNDNKDTSRNQ